MAGGLIQQPQHPEAEKVREELARLDELLSDEDQHSFKLSRALLASFVRPNHPEVAVIARDAAERLGSTTGDSSFSAFQSESAAEAEQRADATVTAIYEALQARSIAYSEPPPGWDYRGEGQRIRDHGDVASHGLGTCMDTTVLMAAVIEHVGLNPVLVQIPGHIFVGYWRRDPLPERATVPQWYPNTPLFDNPASLLALIDGDWLGLIETTTFTTGKSVSAAEARHIAQDGNIARGLSEGFVMCVDVTAARRAGVSPLPAVIQRADGAMEIIEYRPGGSATVTQVAADPADTAAKGRQVDNHPARYRTWKSALFNLNATNALLNLGNNPRVQPLVLPPQSLGILEDKLHQDVSFSLHSTWDIDEVARARGAQTASELSDDEVLASLLNRRLFVDRRVGVLVKHPETGEQFKASAPARPSVFASEIRSMARNAKVAREERGMNPLFLCLGLVRWQYKPGAMAEAPLILVPVNTTIARGRQEFTLSLDATQQTAPNAALIEWLRREHGLIIPGLAEPLTDRAGLDVDGVLAEVREAVVKRGLALDLAPEARLAILDLSAFRMWQDLNLHADTFLKKPLIRHLVETPTERFANPAIASADSAAGEGTPATELEDLDTPVPADATQKRAVLWARQGRTFVLQGPPGTGKSQTITNMVAECITSGLRVLFVAEKGTALAVVQRRLDAIGLAPFTLNLHHEGSNSTEVRAQLKRALSASVAPDPTAMENAHRRLRNARFELMQYPQRIHEPNAAGLSAYTAHDQLLVLGEGQAISVPRQLVAHQPETVTTLREVFQSLQPWTMAAGVRPNHPWRLAGAGDGDPFDLTTVRNAVADILEGTRWAATTSGPLRAALEHATHPSQFQKLAAAVNTALTLGSDLAGVLDVRWPTAAAETVLACERAIDDSAAKLHGFAADIVLMDLRGIADRLDEATKTHLLGRGRRQAAALAPLAVEAPPSVDLHPGNATAILHDLITAQDVGQWVQASLRTVPGLGSAVASNPLKPGSLQPARRRLDELSRTTAGLRDDTELSRRVQDLAKAGQLSDSGDALVKLASAWWQLWTALTVHEDDFQAWRGEANLLSATEAITETWRREVEDERLLPLQRWCGLVRRLEPLRQAGLDSARVALLDGSLPAYEAEDALARGLAKASYEERVATAGLDRFNSVAHDQRITSYAQAETEFRRQWITDAPATLLEQRGGGGGGSRTGGLARELEKTTRRLATRAILTKYGEAVQELVPLVLCSPSSAVDLIQPGVMEFDVVIFDEASQITVPEAVGALGRASAAIVVGDSKQMPPSRRIGRGSTDDEEIEDPDADEIVEDQESILSECELARVPTLRLNWHYRSQDEALIAFSNAAYYRGELSSFPTPTLLSSETGVQWRRVHWPERDNKGMYLRAGAAKVDLGNGIVAGANTNPMEAQEIVRYVEELVREADALPSLGIVTFNEQQRQLLEDLLHASSDARVAEVMDESRMGRGEALFVKALEQVQGDERDTIIFSVAFSKQANNTIPTNFGPLTNSGGERRLNVAVTRARRRNVVFCSFDPSHLDVSGSSYDGPKDLKKFLEFAEASGAGRTLAQTANRVPVRDRHRDDIANALRDAGLHVMSDVGLSNFRIDLVLARPTDPTRPILPVLLDGESRKKRITVSDRDVLPVEVLHNLMGWPAVLRVWWPMWLQNRQEAIDRILTEVDLAEAQLAQLGQPRAAAPVLAPNEVVVPEPEPEDSASYSARIAPQVAVAVDGHAPSPIDPHPAPPAPGATAPRPLSVDPQYRPRRVANEHPPEAGTTAGLPSTSPGSDAAHPAAEPRDNAGTEFTPANTHPIGSKDVLDALPDRTAAAIVRTQLIDVIEAEGPIELARLTRIVARRFGLSSVRAPRAEAIGKLIPRGQLRKGQLGSFAWPALIDPATWTGFRSADANMSRTLDEVAPEEIANAMQAFLAKRPMASEEDVLRTTAELFGVVRLGANVRSRLEAVYRRLPATRGT